MYPSKQYPMHTLADKPTIYFCKKKKKVKEHTHCSFLHSTVHYRNLSFQNIQTYFFLSTTPLYSMNHNLTNTNWQMLGHLWLFDTTNNASMNIPVYITGNITFASLLPSILNEDKNSTKMYLGFLQGLIFLRDV